MQRLHSLLEAGVVMPRDASTPRPSAPSPTSTARRLVDAAWKLAIVASLVALIALGARTGHLPWMLPERSIAGVAWLALSAGWLAYGLVCGWHALFYRPVAAPDDGELPTCTVVVPAYNEGAMVRTALESALASRYPQDALRVVAIDDGSTDDTWEHIRAVATRASGRLTAIRLAHNSGKREALRQGFLRAQSDVVVTVDSDSKLEPDALRHVVAPIVADREIAAVAGKVVVLNRHDGLLTRLLAARFFVTFDLCRAVQSRFGAVLCCPGALTAYRRSAVLAVLERWSSQTFLGAPCTIGEDRALTTWLLRAGHRAVYQSSALVRTLVPSTLSGVARMLLRWERGNVRESVLLVPVLATRWRARDRWWPTIEVLLDLAQIPLAIMALPWLLAEGATAPMMLVRIGVAVALASLLQSLYCLRSEKSTDFLYNVGYAFLAAVALPWVFPWSCITLRDGRWLTR